MRAMCRKLITAIIQNVLGRNRGRYRVDANRMNSLCRSLGKERPAATVDDLLDQCVRLERSRREHMLDVISQTAVALLYEDVISLGSMTPRQLNAHKSMYVAMDCIDLLLYTFEPDYDDEVDRHWNNRQSDLNMQLSASSLKKSSGG